MFEFFVPLTISETSAISPITLAFVGDAVFSLYVRHMLTIGADRPPAVLQKLTSQKVSAHGQNEYLRTVSPLFTEEEEAVFKRGRNAKKPSHSKNADIAEYNNSTGLEAVIGWLYLSGQNERLLYLLGELK